MLHYNFPPYSVGEAGRVGSRDSVRSATASSPGVRSIRSSVQGRVPLHHPIVSRDYRIQRLVFHGNRLRDITGNDGAGVPLPRPVAGIAMGLIKEGDDFAVLSDILGDEDHLGDMDSRSRHRSRVPRCRWISRSPRSRVKSWIRPLLRQRTAGFTFSEMHKALGTT